MKLLIEKLKKVLTNKELWYIYLFCNLIGINIIVNFDNNYCVLISICLLLLYFYKTRKKRLEILLMIIHYALLFAFSEYLIMKFTNGKAIHYSKMNKHTIFGLPLWLFLSAYPSMILVLIAIQDFWNILLN